MNRVILKLIAVISMFIDHLAVALRLGGILQTGILYRIMRDFGRLAFPIYGLMLVEGVLHTSNKWTYLLRLSFLPFFQSCRLIWRSAERCSCGITRMSILLCLWASL